mmetsp:Transcript_23265/g.62093  ORF Transcript_23265/g.62093 Transcript_23265/m.62093 type:complete len:591 (-) Transcript_23265:86-1858(-)
MAGKGMKIARFPSGGPPSEGYADSNTTVGHTAFSVAIKHLSGLHDDEVASLKAEVCRLRAMLQHTRGKPPAGPRAYGGPLTMVRHPLAEGCSWSPRSLEERSRELSGETGRFSPALPPNPALEHGRDEYGETDPSEPAGLKSDRSLMNSKPKGAYLASIVEAAHEDVFASASKEKRSVFHNLCSRSTLVFESVIGTVIAVNTVIIGVSTDFPWEGWLWVDAVFFAIFLVELILKIVGNGCCEFIYGVDKKWNLFEACLVLLALAELVLGVALATTHGANSGTKLMSLARIVRLFRLTRIIRLARLEIFCDLVVMIRGTLGGMRTLLWSAVVIALPLYALALFFRETLGHLKDQGNGAENFATLPASFFTMFRCVVATDCNDIEGYPIFLMVSEAYGWGYGLVYCMTTLFMAFGLFNVIVAIFVENVMGAAKTNDQLVKKQRLRDQTYLGDKMVELLMVVWDTYQKDQQVEHVRASHNLSLSQLVSLAAPMEISPALFDKLRHTSKVKEILSDLDVADEDQANLFETLDVDGSGTIDVEELCEGIAKLRGDARRSDIVGVNLQIRNLQWSLHHVMSLIESHSAASEPTTPK